MSIKKILLMIVMIGGLGGAMLLVKMTLDTRKGATVAESSTSILPSEINNAVVGTNMQVSLYVNTGSDNDKMSAGELEVRYDRSKLRYVSTTMVEPFALSKEPIDSGSGNLKIYYVSQTANKGGASEVAKLTFVPLVASNSSIVALGKILIQEPALAEWTVATNNEAVVKMESNVSPTSAEISPTAGVTSTVSPTAGVSPTGGSVSPTGIVNECTSDTACSNSQKCTNNKCVDLDCGQVSGTECKAVTTAPHSCPTLTNRDDGTVCTNGTCKNGLCVSSGDGTATVSTFKFRVAMAGVMPGSKCGVDDMVKVVVKKNDGSFLNFDNVGIAKVNDGDAGVTYYEGAVLVNGESLTNATLFIKGSQHLQMKYVVDGQSGRSESLNGYLNTSASKIYNFTKYPMLPGDVNGDGWVNGQDFSIVKSLAEKYESVGEGQYLKGDLDGTCQVNTRDVTLLVKSLSEKQDELY